MRTMLTLAAMILLGAVAIGAATWTDETVLVSEDVIPDLQEAGVDGVINGLIKARGGRLTARTILNTVNDYLRDTINLPEIQMGVLQVYVQERMAAGAITAMAAPAAAVSRLPAPAGLTVATVGGALVVKADAVDGAASYTVVAQVGNDATTRRKVTRQQPGMPIAAVVAGVGAEPGQVIKMTVGARAADGAQGWFALPAVTYVVPAVE